MIIQQANVELSEVQNIIHISFTSEQLLKLKSSILSHAVRPIDVKQMTLSHQSSSLQQCNQF